MSGLVSSSLQALVWVLEAGSLLLKPSEEAGQSQLAGRGLDQAPNGISGSWSSPSGAGSQLLPLR